ncbi:MAG: hypothetical protein MI922_01465, partial [Bacteroidales bacterium]|nr:hypothetical protein [Bacteroidales bacterium]
GNVWFYLIRTSLTASPGTTITGGFVNITTANPENIGQFLGAGIGTGTHKFIVDKDQGQGVRTFFL